MLEEKISAKQKDEIVKTEDYQKLLKDFFDNVPDEGPLFNKEDFSNKAERRVFFQETYKMLRGALEGYKTYASDEERENILKRIPIIKREAYFWSKITDRDFTKQIDEFVSEKIPEEDIKKFKRNRSNLAKMV